MASRPSGEKQEFRTCIHIVCWQLTLSSTILLRESSWFNSEAPSRARRHACSANPSPSKFPKASAVTPRVAPQPSAPDSMRMIALAVSLWAEGLLGKFRLPCPRSSSAMVKTSEFVIALRWRWNPREAGGLFHCPQDALSDGRAVPSAWVRARRHGRLKRPPHRAAPRRDRRTGAWRCGSRSALLDGYTARA